MSLTNTRKELDVTFTDGANDTRRNYEVIAADDTEFDAVIADVIPVLVALSDAGIKSYRKVYLFEETGTITVASGAQVENNARFTLGLQGRPSESGTLDFPAPKIGAFVAPTGPNSNVINFAASIVSNFVNLFKNGTSVLRFSDGEEASADSSRWKGKRVHHKSTRG